MRRLPCPAVFAPVQPGLADREHADAGEKQAAGGRPVRESQGREADEADAGINVRHQVALAGRGRHRVAPNVAVDGEARTHFRLRLRQPSPGLIDGGAKTIAGEAELKRGRGSFPFARRYSGNLG